MHEGVVKWFNKKKNFGFIESNEQQDIFFHGFGNRPEGLRLGATTGETPSSSPFRIQTKHNTMKTPSFVRLASFGFVGRFYRERSGSPKFRYSLADDPPRTQTPARRARLTMAPVTMLASRK